MRQLELVDSAFMRRPDGDLPRTLRAFCGTQTLRLIAVPVPQRAWLAPVAVAAMGPMTNLGLLEVVQQETGRAAA